MSDYVTLTLAHPLDEKGARRVRAKDIKDYPRGSKITVPREEGRGIISAGYAAGIDPEENDQVREALGLPAAPVAEDPAPAPAPSKSTAKS